MLVRHTGFGGATFLPVTLFEVTEFSAGSSSVPFLAAVGAVLSSKFVLLDLGVTQHLCGSLVEDGLGKGLLIHQSAVRTPADRGRDMLDVEACWLECACVAPGFHSTAALCRIEPWK